MKKIASGDGWFDIEMTADEREVILHGLNFILKHYDALDDLETPLPSFIKKDIRVLKKGSKSVEGNFVIHYTMSPYISTSVALWSLLATIDANQIDVAKLDPMLEVEKMRAAKKALNEALPIHERTADLYPRNEHKFLTKNFLERDHGKEAP